MPALFPVSMTVSGTKRLCVLYRPTVPVLSRTGHWYRDQTDNQGKSWMTSYLVATAELLWLQMVKSQTSPHVYNSKEIVIFDLTPTQED